MKVTEIRLRNFKRFTDLRIKDIPSTAKLVLVVGPNGAGKSSLFDALYHWYKNHVGFGNHSDEQYYRKSREETFGWVDSVQVSVADGNPPKRGSLYLRTAYRNDPDFQIGGLSRLSPPSEQIRINRVIDNDQTVSENYQRLVYDTISGVYDNANDTKTIADLREELIGSVRSSMLAVFGDLMLENITDPLGDGTFYFSKGTARHYHYKNLSGGEKAAFDLLLDVHIKRKFYREAVYCIDEMETHLHTRVQGALMKELVNIIPDEAQLWVTTHSLGVIRAAQEIEALSPGTVSIIDFDQADPDVPREIVPSNLGRLAWEKMLSIALDDLSLRVAPRIVVLCEGSSTGNRRKDFDAEIYNRILGQEFGEITFMSGGSAIQVSASGISVRAALASILPSTKIIALCDRDDKSEGEVTEFEAGGNLVLPRRNLESFLLADDVIEALVRSVQKNELLEDALRIKVDALSASRSRGNAFDDVKSAAGQIYTGLKQLLSLQRCGNNTETFLRDTLAPLIRPGMLTYIELKQGIIDRLPR